MRLSSGFRAALMALIVAFAGAGLTSAAHADGGTISFRVLKGGWFIGASGGSGWLVFHGQRYPISIGGLSAGLVFGRRRRISTAPSAISTARTTSPASMARPAAAAPSASALRPSCCATKRARC